METKNIYQDISQRTDGNIYIGVVGPVRTGKSTFIKRFMEQLVLPNIENISRRDRATDELPQSSVGKTIMTTEPKFIPEEAVKININNEASMNVRLIDCVGYIVPSSIGYFENDMPRMVMTPWIDREIPFNMAAEIGTKKVINEHSTIGLVVTTDGSISDIPREEYAEAEERVINELKSINKPFIILLNSENPSLDSVKRLGEELELKYEVPVLPVSCLDLSEDDIKGILAKILFEFPLKEIKIDMPKWVTTLSKDHWLKSSIYDFICHSTVNINHISEVNSSIKEIENCEFIKNSYVENIDLGSGSASANVSLMPDLFYKILGEMTGIAIEDESNLIPCMRELSETKKKYEKVKDALDEVAATGYGIVMPCLDELSLEEPEIVKQGGRYGVKLKASAPSIHMIRIKLINMLG